MICRVFQLLISRARDRGREPCASAWHHIAACGACRRFSRECDAIEMRLRGEHRRGQEQVPSALHAGIMRAVRTSAPGAAPAVGATAALWRAAIAVGMALVLVYASFVVFPLSEGEPVEDESVALAQMHAELSAVAVEAPALVSAPMEQEMAHFESDVRRTTAYLLAQLSY